MSDLIISGLVITTGVMSAGVGWLTAVHRLQIARRAYRRTEALNADLLGGWNDWFLGGFAGVSLGTQWLSATAAWLLWTLAGVGLITLGVRLLAPVL